MGFAILVVRLLSLAFAASSLSVPPVQARQEEASCKPYPGDVSWPTEGSWAALNKSVDGRLLAALKPPGAACYPPVDASTCENAAENWTNDTFHAQDPVSVEWPNWLGNDTCIPPKLAKEPVGCDLAKVPPYVLNATSATDVAAGVKFAGETGVRVVVKATGHDFLGRSTAPGALSIWTRHVRKLEYHEAFSTCGNPKGAAVTVGAGHRWSEVYGLVNAKGKTIVGGANPSVGVAGWLVGGGHSWISAKYGLGVDNTYEMEVVTPKGEILVANECTNTDLFWAMRGGGGATFGVLTSVTLRVLDDEPATTVSFSMNATAAESAQNRNTKFWEAVAFFYGQLPRLSDEAGIMGQFAAGDATSKVGSYSKLAGSVRDDTPLAFTGRFQALSVPADAVRAAFQPILDHVAAVGTASLVVDLKVQSLPSVITKAQNHSGAALGTNLLFATRLLDKEGVTHPRLPAVLRELANLAGGIGGLMVTGPGIRALPTDAAAVTPAWRRAYFHCSALVSWPLGTDGTATIRGMVERAGPLLTSLAPRAGAYINENNPFNPRWREDFFGANYPRLLRIQKALDPDGVFWCPVCVGSEGWAVREDGRLCRK